MTDCIIDEGDDLLDYDEEEEVEKTTEEKVEVKQGSYVGIHSSGFKDFLLKPELMRAVVDCGFEHPSQVQVSSIFFMSISRRPCLILTYICI